jgi:histidinol dehydrogenase
MKNGMLLVVAPDLAAGMDLCNRFAPEHLELLVRKPEQWLKKVRCAGAAFVGPWSPESAGDFAACGYRKPEDENEERLSGGVLP